MIYDTSELELIQSGSGTTIIQNPNNSHSRKKYAISSNFLKNDGGFGNDTVTLRVDRDQLKLKRGIDKVFHKWLVWTKKPSTSSTSK